LDVLCNVSLIACVVEAYAPFWLSLLKTSVIRVNPLQIAIASGSGVEDSPYSSRSKMVTWTKWS